jgi:hypothetical protein
MVTLIDVQGEIYRMVGPETFAEGEKPAEFLDVHDAFHFLARLTEDSFNEMAMRRWAEEHSLIIDPSENDWREILLQLAGLIISGRIRVLREGDWWHSDVFGRSAVEATEQEEEEEEEEEEETPADEDELTWIKFEIVDDETGDPVKGVTLKLKLPDGREVNAKSDGSGMIEVKDIPSGTVDILRMIDSDTLEVVSVE